MSTQTTIIPSAATSASFDVSLVQNAAGANPGNPLTGLAYNSSGLTCYWNTKFTAPAAITLATQTNTGAYSSGGFVERDATHTPGNYRFDLPPSLLPLADELSIVFNCVASNLATHTVKIIPADRWLLALVATAGAANGTRPNVAQALLDIRQFLYELGVVAVTGTVKDVDHSTALHTVTFNDAANPSSRTQGS